MLLITIQCLFLAFTLSAIPTPPLAEVILELSAKSGTHRVSPHRASQQQTTTHSSSLNNLNSNAHTSSVATAAQAHRNEITPAEHGGGGSNHLATHHTDHLAPGPRSDLSSSSSTPDKNKVKLILGGVAAAVVVGGVTGGSVVAYEKIKGLKPSSTTATLESSPTLTP